MVQILKNDWINYLQQEFSKDYYLRLRAKLKEDYKTKVVYPPMEDIFNALHYTSYEDTKVLILGQDPYHQKGQAHGLSFSVNEGIKIPPSLQNIYKELCIDVGTYIPNHGCLKKWCEQGVLLLNTTLTVLDSQPNSHQNIGWQSFTDKVIQVLNEKEKPMVFILWGRNAILKRKFLTNSNHLVLTSVHPSPLSASKGFFGSKPFSKTNDFLRLNNIKEIDWQIENI